MHDNCENRRARGASSLDAEDEPRQLEQLRLEIADLRASRRRIVVAHDADRRDIERDFHAGVQQRLVGLAANLQLAEGSLETYPAATKALLMEMGGELGRTIQHARDIASRIYAPMLETGGLVPALRMAAAEANVRTRIDMPSGTAVESALASMVYMCCLDVFERAAPGASVTVILRTDDATTTFEMVVEGGGIDGASLPARDRVEALGGRLSFGTDAEGRTRIVGSVRA